MTSSAPSEIETQRFSAEAGPAEEPWRSRGYLPHFDGVNIIQLVTFRLADAVPSSVLDAWKSELRWQDSLASNDRRRAILRMRISRYEDAGCGACWLRRAEIAELVQRALLHFDGIRYRLLAWCVMPNHVHVLCERWQQWPIGAVIHSWKSYTAKRANERLKLKGRFWAPEYHDRFIRDEEHLYSALNYVEQNPVKAGLVKTASLWKWSSAHRRTEMGHGQEHAGQRPAVPG